MNRRRALMVFSGAFEFKREHNKEIEERENDSEELISIMKKIEEHERNIAKPPTDQVLHLILCSFLLKLDFSPSRRHMQQKFEFCTLLIFTILISRRSCNQTWRLFSRKFPFYTVK